MFPQSELDNYKLQVELLQEKLQRSEISRQQLEHKLDKILQKRNDHDKMIRSKARQKYQKFLEEQERRNERNKQLVHMLERIEQQTEAMHAKSERLKMMKLQYEMYFAKLVHSQTRRCIQNTINPTTHMMPTTSTQPTIEPPILGGYNYEVNIEAPTPTTSYTDQTHDETSHFENESFLRSPAENAPMNSIEMRIPRLENFGTILKNDCRDFRNPNVASLTQMPPSTQYQPKYERINNITPTGSGYNNQQIPHTQHNISYHEFKPTMSSVTNLLNNDKQLSECNGNSNTSTVASSTFDPLSNLEAMPHHPSEVLIKTHNDTANNKDILKENANIQPLDSTHESYEISLKYTNNNYKNTKINNTSENNKKEIKTHVVHTENVLKTDDMTMPILQKKPLTSIHLETSEKFNENSSNWERTSQIEGEYSEKTIESNSSKSPVSIENIENEIYGELLSPLETEEQEKSDSPNGIPKLLENLVTQHKNIEIENIPCEEAIAEDNGSTNINTATDAPVPENKTEETHVTHNYDQAETYNDYNNIQQSQELDNGFIGYSNNENVNSTPVDANQQPQYDYSNYDPTQYTYPGYIYDETTGEYKPDPNAPAEQYSIDQQYASETAYDEQYQQQNYDYNQTYSEDPTVASKSESKDYNNYDTQQQEISSNLTPIDTNAESEQTKPLQPDLKEEQNPTSRKVIKPTSILSTAEKNDAQKKKKRVNFIDSTETDESTAVEKGPLTTDNPIIGGNSSGSSGSDFDFSSSTEAEAKAT